MQIDRSRFLLLTASLAAAACNQPRPADNPDTGSADPVSEPVGKADTTQANEGVWLEIEPGTEDKRQEFGNADCDNTMGRPPPCNLSPPGPGCESFDSTTAACNGYSAVMQPRAAEAAVNCMVAASGSWQICDWALIQTCSDAGVQATCVEPSTRPECDSISSACGGSLDVFKCQQILSAVKPHKMQQVSSCIREFCDATFCVTDLGFF